jgi:hypothetical protein
MSNSSPENQASSTFFEGTDIVGTVGTMYSNPDEPRFEVALDTAERYRAAGLPLVVVDSSKPEDAWVRAAFEERGALVLLATTGGIASQRQQGVAFAINNGAKRVVGHEPEKNLMVEFAADIRDALDKNDVLVIGRTLIAEYSVPPVQQRTERLAGWILEKTLQLPPDALSGGRGFSVAGADCLAAYPATVEGMNNWIYLYDTPLEARARELKVGSLLVDLMHPETIVAEETDNPVYDAKRYMQFNLQLRYLLERPEVTEEAWPVAQFVRNLLEPIPVKAAPENNRVYEWLLDDLETRLTSYGYSRAIR